MEPVALTPEGRSLMAGYVRDVWRAVHESDAVDEVLVHLLLDQEGFMIEPAVRTGARWLRLQQLDDHIEHPVGSRRLSRQLDERWDEGLFGEDFDVLTSGAPRATRVIARSLAPDAAVAIDCTSEAFWELEESSFGLLREWWARLESTGEASASR